MQRRTTEAKEDSIARVSLLVCEVDGHVGHEVGHGNSGVTITELLVGIDIINEDDEVLAAGLVMDLGLGRLAAGHLDGGT